MWCCFICHVFSLVTGNIPIGNSDYTGDIFMTGFNVIENSPLLVFPIAIIFFLFHPTFLLVVNHGLFGAVLCCALFKKYCNNAAWQHLSDLFPWPCKSLLFQVCSCCFHHQLFFSINVLLFQCISQSLFNYIRLNNNKSHCSLFKSLCVIVGV